MGIGFLDIAQFGYQVGMGYLNSRNSAQRGENAYNQNMQSAAYAGLSAERNATVSRSNASLSRLDAAAARELAGLNAAALRAEAGDWQRVTDLNAQEYANQAEYVRWRGGFTEDRLWEDAARLRGEQEMAFMHTGVSVSEGSPIDMALSTIRAFAIDAFIIRSDTEEEVRHLFALSEIEKESGGAKVRSLLRSAALEIRRGAISARRYGAQAANYEMQASYDEEMGDLYQSSYEQTAESERDYHSDMAISQGLSSLGQGLIDLYS